MPAPVPPYVAGHRLLEGRTVVVTAAAGTGIGSAVARRCIEEGATVLISDAHERRLAEAAEEPGRAGRRAGRVGGVTPARLRRQRRASAALRSARRWRPGVHASRRLRVQHSLRMGR